jgi:hypothetical protein
MIVAEKSSVRNRFSESFGLICEMVPNINCEQPAVADFLSQLLRQAERV